MRKVLYFGLEIPKKWEHKQEGSFVVHCPLIAIQGLSHNDPQIAAAFFRYAEYTHVVLTSKVAVRLFFSALEHYHQKAADKIIIAVGRATAQSILEQNSIAVHVASEESSEGIVKLLEPLDLNGSYFLWPCSALSRKVIPHFFESKGIPFCMAPLYTTVANESCRELLRRHLKDADELVFTSPSTVAAFITLYGPIPRDKQITSIGPVTAEALSKSQRLKVKLRS